MINLVQVRISLDFTHPEIYRVVVVPRDITFLEFHHVIQISMGWKNQHLFGFIIDGYRVGEIDDNFILGENIINCRTTILKDLIIEGDEFKYEYDFGVNWLHTIKIEKFDHEKLQPKQIPYCIKGKMKCPPENCGGIPGFQHFLSIMADVSHKEFRKMIVLAGEYFNPTKFSKVTVNRRLRNIDGYLKLWEEDGLY
jgi:hypothetical protein